MNMKQARKQFANRSYLIKEVKDPQSGQPYDVKVRKRSPLGTSFRAWARANLNPKECDNKLALIMV